MRFIPGSLLLTLLLCSLSPVHGVLEAYNTNLKCKCIQHTSFFFPIRHIDRVQIVSPGNGCPNMEVIIWLKNKSVVCLNPKAKSTKKLMNVLWRKTFPSTPPTPVSKSMTT
ncbi:C-X-C motif chemokine 13 [Equus przewalskii]|uniref:C-X-C motif chemokine n=2 Tax=Equus TaxID=9789 RepID=F6ZX45_HORSE|nr:C-X-C motif chemokine 13 [Equus caballus]XP_008516081.1 PREDICTED: C-X-C motif chemokine 13 [Equus przewalskii]